MITTVLWALLAVGLVIVELVCRISERNGGAGHVGARCLGVSALLGLVARGVLGRLSLFVLWGFVGFHLFARDGLLR